jgi:hypothetical protein
MSEQTSLARPSPYRGILPFRYADRANFFGREREISELAAKILLYRLVVLFGDSGAGKSSLINAGVIPRLENEGFQPERLRVRPFAESPFLVERISSGRQENRFLPSVFADFAHDGSHDSREVYCSLGSFEWAISQASREHPLVLILDQFEELFTLFEPASRVLQAKILGVIAGAASQQDLAAKFVLGIREDYLGRLEIISKAYPQVFDRRLRLDLLGADAAKRAVIGPFKQKNTYAAEISADTADAIISEFGEGAESTGIHPTQLQIVCSQLWDQYSGETSVITREKFLALSGVKGILEGFLESAVSALSPSQKGTRDVVSEARLKSWRVQAAQEEEKPLADVLLFLDEKRLINRTSQHGMSYYEVASEYLVAPIQEYNRLRECKEAERKAAEAAAKEANEAAQVRELDQARLLALEQTRLAEAERKRAEFKARNVKRLKILSGILIVVSISCIMSIISSIGQAKRANMETERANSEAARANREADLAKKRADDLEKAKEEAVANWQDALAANIKLTEMQRQLTVSQIKTPIDYVTDDARIKREALSKDPERLRNVLERRPSRISFDVDMKEIGADRKIGKIYRFELFPRTDTIDGGLNSLALITMLTDDPSFKKSILEAGPAKRYVCSYEGWGCLDNVVAVIEFRDPARRAEVTIIRMCDILSKKYGRVQKK